VSASQYNLPGTAENGVWYLRELVWCQSVGLKPINTDVYQ